MINLDWNSVSDDDGTLLPEGKYLVRVIGVREKTTRSGDVMWQLTLSVQDGEHEGAHLWDNVIFSQKALRRAKLIFSSLGFITEGEQELTPDMLKGRRCIVSVLVEEYEGRERNAVAFWGYESVPEEDVPF